MRLSAVAVAFAIIGFLAIDCLSGQTIVDPSIFQVRNSGPYKLDKGDTLGVFIESVLGEVNGMPPVQQPAPGSKLPPSMGFPTPVLHDGTISVPLVERVPVRGLTVPQVEQLLKKIYREGDNPIITKRSRVIVTLMRERTINVTVIREDQSQAAADPRFSRGGRRSAVAARSDRSGRVVNLQLPAGENDMLTAMMQSGGLPGVNAQESARVYRAQRPPYPPVGQVNLGGQSAFPRSGQPSVRYNSRGQRVDSIPLRATAGSSFASREQVRLNNGDIVRIGARPTEVYYTGGLLNAGEFLIPRDRQLSIMEAISLSGGIPQAQQQQFGVPLQQPGQLRVLRRNGGSQFTMRFDLRSGFSQRASQPPVRPGDYLILDFSPADRVRNIGTGVFNTFGIRELLR